MTRSVGVERGNWRVALWLLGAAALLYVVAIAGVILLN
jgi:hypothetical protein